MSWRGLHVAIAAVVGICFGVAPAWGMMPRPAHVVVVVEENHSGDEIVGSASDAPFLNSLAAKGAVFTNSFAIAHPSQPNYLALFSGSTQGSTDDDYPPPMTSPNLGAQLIAAGDSFVGYSEELPAVGSLIENSSMDDLNRYVHKHNPWANWQADAPTGNQLAPWTNQPFSNFPTDCSMLPTVSFVIPDEQNDMHDGTVAQADQWLCANLSQLDQQLAATNTLLIITFDEDDDSENNQIPTIMLGKMVKPGIYSEPIDHYTVLRTIESFYGLPGIGNAEGALPISDAFVGSLSDPIPEPAFAAPLIGLGMLARLRKLAESLPIFPLRKSCGGVAGVSL